MKRSLIHSLLFRWFPYPPDYVGRAECVSALDCHMCPHDRCTGQLNDTREPDIDKPRAQYNLRSIHGVTKDGAFIHFSVSLDGYNQHLSCKRTPDDPLPNADPLPAHVEPDRMRWRLGRYFRYRSGPQRAQ